jgi:cell division protein FtsN
MNDSEIIDPNYKFDDPFSDEPFDEPRPGMSGRVKTFAGAAIFVGVVALGAVGWFAFQQGIRSGAEETAPVVRATPEPFKRRPADPGGLNVPHQDKLVFNRLAPGQVQEPVERLLPPPEEPTERPQPPVVVVPEPAPPPLFAPSPAVPEKAAPVVAEKLPGIPVVPPTTSLAPPPPPPPAASKPATAPAPPAVVPKIVAPPPPSPPKVAAATPTPAPAAAKAATGKWRIQIASVSSKAAADSEWARVKGRNTDILGAMDLNIQTIKLDRGTFYRIQAGPLADREAASALCSELKTRSQNCLVVAP